MVRSYAVIYFIAVITFIASSWYFTELQNLILAIFLTFSFFFFSLKMYQTSVSNEGDLLHIDLITSKYARYLISAYRDIVGFRLSSVIGLVFFSFLILFKVLDEPTTSNFLEIMFIFGGVLSLQFLHLLDMIYSEPRILNVRSFSKKREEFTSLQQVKLEGIVKLVTTRTYGDFELIDFEMEDIRGSSIQEVTYIHRSLSAVPQIMQGSRIRLYGDYIPKNTIPPFTYRHLPLKYPRIITVEGYGEVEEIAFINEELILSHDLNVGLSKISINTSKMDEKTEAAKMLAKTEVDRKYSIDDFINLMEGHTELKIRKYLNILLEGDQFEIVRQNQDYVYQRK